MNCTVCMDCDRSASESKCYSCTHVIRLITFSKHYRSYRKMFSFISLSRITVCSKYIKHYMFRNCTIRKIKNHITFYNLLIQCTLTLIEQYYYLYQYYSLYVIWLMNFRGTVSLHSSRSLLIRFFGSSLVLLYFCLFNVCLYIPRRHVNLYCFNHSN